MDIIDGIRKKFNRNQFEFSKHAVDRMILRYITVGEVREAIENATT